MARFLLMCQTVPDQMNVGTPPPPLPVDQQENQRKNLETEITGFKSEAQAQRRNLFALEKEREKYGQQVPYIYIYLVFICPSTPSWPESAYSSVDPDWLKVYHSSCHSIYQQNIACRGILGD